MKTKSTPMRNRSGIDRAYIFVKWEKGIHMKIRFKKLDDRAVMPTYGTEFSAGADLYAVCDGNISVMPGQTVFVHTGLAMEIPEGYVGLVFARSGLACKSDLAPANKVGVIDPDYRGEFMVALHNHGSSEREISCGDRIAQFVVVPFIHAEFEEAEELAETLRGEGGFGSTGKR